MGAAVYPLLNKHNYWKISILNRKIHYKWLCSIAMLNYQRVLHFRFIPTTVSMWCCPASGFHWFGCVSGGPRCSRSRSIKGSCFGRTPTISTCTAHTSKDVYTYVHPPCICICVCVYIYIYVCVCMLSLSLSRIHTYTYTLYNLYTHTYTHVLYYVYI